MNIRKWKENPALQETKDILETKLEDKKVRGILNWIFQIAVVLIFGILAGIALFQSVTVQRILIKLKHWMPELMTISPNPSL